MSPIYSHIDPAVLMNAAGDDEAGFADLLAMFVRIVPDMARQLRDAVGEQRRADIAQYAHSLKSCMSLIGAADCGARLEQLERAARDDAPDGGAGFDQLYELILAVLAEALECHAATTRTPGSATPESSES
jgi:HPt (histidine-containing phosphotransfer) domain-containing protein